MKTNKLNKKVMIGISALAVLAMVAGGMLAVDAAGNRNFSRSFSQEDRDSRMAERNIDREALEAALEAKDFKAWQEVAQNCPMQEQINEENFSQFAKAHDLKNEARVIMEDIGVERGSGMRGQNSQCGKQGRGMRQGQCPMTNIQE